jgi:predicted acylesterase/phospholipase RssA
VISAASGGALTAGYYAVTCAEPQQDQCKRALDKSREPISRRPWRRDDVYERLSRDFVVRSLFSRFWPANLFRTLFTAYDNTDIFASVLSDNLYDSPYIGKDFRVSDINPERPIVVIDATNFTEDRPRDTFTFTEWDFGDNLRSDICKYELGRAIAASSAYPAFFNYTTLSQFKADGDGSVVDGYVHLFDAGASDNLAITGMVSAIQNLAVGVGGSTDSATILVIDAQNGFGGRTRKISDPRTPLDRIVDKNFYDVYDTLMAANYSSMLRHLVEQFT